jgi:DNA-binding CsgD family transcriptional regulator
LQQCQARITPHHSITSRRYSLATLVREHVDAEIAVALDAYQGDWSHALLADFQLSYVWSRSPSKRLEPIETETKSDRALRMSAAWRDRLKQASLSAQRLQASATRGTKSSKSLAVFCATLDTLISFIDDCSALVPQKTSGPDGSVKGSRGVRYSEFCELCWRRTQYFVSVQSGALTGARGNSKRFCAEHTPWKSTAIDPDGKREANSEYRRALAYKAQFHAELKALESMVPSRHSITQFAADAEAVLGYRIHFSPVSQHEEDMRRAAYALVHSRLRGTRENAILLKCRGLDAKEIGLRLGLSERAIWYALGTAEKRARAGDLIRWGARSFPLSE